MRRNGVLLWIFCVVGIALFLAGCSHSTQPAATIQTADVQSTVAGAIANDELTVTQLAGVAVDSVFGEFSLDWNQFVGPVDHGAPLGNATAVVFDHAVATPSPRSAGSGIDIGSVYLNYSGNHQAFDKVQPPFGGTFYSIFPHLFHETGSGVTFAGSANYEFEVTGSSAFSAMKVSVTTPPALISITSHAQGQQVSADSDLALTWSGGNATGDILVRVTPMIGFGPGGFAPCDSGAGPGDPRGGHGGPGGRGPGMGPGGNGMPPGIHDGGPRGPMRIDTGYVVIVKNNPGMATISAAVITQILNGATQLSVTVSQLMSTNFTHDGGTYRLVMRDGDRRMVRVH